MKFKRYLRNFYETQLILFIEREDLKDFNLSFDLKKIFKAAFAETNIRNLKLKKQIELDGWVLFY